MVGPWNASRSASAPMSRPHERSEAYVRPALQSQNLARIVRCSDREPQPFDDLPCCAHLRCIRLGERARSKPQAVLEANTHVAAHRCRLRRDGQLIAAGAEHAPAVLITEEPVGRALHVRDIFGMRTDAA